MLIRDLLGMEARVFSCISQFVSISLMAAKFSQDLGVLRGDWDSNQQANGGFFTS
jgi:hypothetical protein